MLYPQRVSRARHEGAAYGGVVLLRLRGVCNLLTVLICAYDHRSSSAYDTRSAPIMLAVICGRESCE